MITGKVIKDTVTKKLSRRIVSGQIALIMHKDLDRTAAQELAAKKVKAVINLKPFISGGYPHQGPLILLQAGIVLYRAKEKLWNLVFEGDEVKIKKGVLYKNSQPVGKCDLLSRSQVTEKIRQAKAGLKYNLNNFIDNSLKYAVQEKNVILNICPPVIDTKIENRQVLVVIRGVDYRKDLAVIKNFIVAQQPLIIAVDGGADGCLETGFTPDLIVGDMDSVSDQALRCGSEIVVHAYPNGWAPGKKRVRKLGLEAKSFAAPGTSEDIALLLAYKKGAANIFTVGSHFGLCDFLDKKRPGMGSTILVRMMIGDQLIDLKGINKLSRFRNNVLSLF